MFVLKAHKLLKYDLLQVIQICFTRYVVNKLHSTAFRAFSITTSKTSVLMFSKSESKPESLMAKPQCRQFRNYFCAVCMSFC